MALTTGTSFDGGCCHESQQLGGGHWRVCVVRSNVCGAWLGLVWHTRRSRSFTSTCALLKINNNNNIANVKVWGARGPCAAKLWDFIFTDLVIWKSRGRERGR